MPIPKCSLILLISWLFAAGSLQASPVPVVYDDEYVSIKAGVPAVGVRPLHIGDVLSLVIAIEYHPGRSRPQLLDGDFFNRSFAEHRSIALIGEPQITNIKQNDGKQRLQATWQFQVLGCPDETTSCPGSRHYELPILSLTYQLVDDAGNTLNHKAARFLPWPGQIAISPALPIVDGDNAFSDLFPAGAYPETAGTELMPGISWIATFAGLILLAASFGRTAAPAKTAAVPRTEGVLSTRWQRALAAAEDRSIDDAKRSDLLRRSFTWYCLDEVGENPYRWLQNGAIARAEAACNSENLRGFFLDLLQQERLDVQQFDQYLRRFAALTSWETGLEKTA